MKLGSGREEALTWRCMGAELVGVLAEPKQSSCGTTAVLIVVGGPQVRTGAHRQFTLLARALADAGWTSLRFDLRGMGDSEGTPGSFENLDDDLESALDALRHARPALTQVVVVGLCDAASAALMLLERRPSVRRQLAGLVLLNPWVRTADTLASTRVRHYYTSRLRDPVFWKKLLSGGVAMASVGELLGSLRTTISRRLARTQDRSAVDVEPAGYVDCMARGWKRFSGPILLVLSGKDYTAREFEATLATQPAWRGALERAGVERIDQPAADHTLSASAEARAFEEGVVRWLERQFG